MAILFPQPASANQWYKPISTRGYKAKQNQLVRYARGGSHSLRQRAFGQQSLYPMSAPESPGIPPFRAMGCVPWAGAQASKPLSYAPLSPWLFTWPIRYPVELPFSIKLIATDNPPPSSNFGLGGRDPRSNPNRVGAPASTPARCTAGRERLGMFCWRIICPRPLLQFPTGHHSPWPF